MEPIRLPMPPSTNALYRNVPGKGRVKSDRYRFWLNAAGWEVKAQKPARHSGPVAVSITVQEDRRRDLDNIAKPCLDLLVTHNIIPDDRAATVREIRLRWDCDVQGVEVELTEA